MDEPSFEKIDYTLRPNKNVQRKLVVEMLSRVGRSPRFKLATYRYVGLGSIWFADFILIHRQLGITDLVSIEREVSRKGRMEFNRPFSCVTVELGPTGDVIPTLDWNKPTIVWLDYDDPLRKYMFDDFEAVLRRLHSGDVLIATVNANVEQIRDVKEEGVLLDPDTALRQVCGDENVPIDVASDLNAKRFPLVVGKILANALITTTARSHADLHFLPLLNITYKDTTRMVTFGGMVVDDSDRGELKASGVEDLEYFAGQGQFEISVPHLTHKERLEFNKILPSAAPPDPSKLPFELKPKEIESYWKFYLQYPVYQELQH